MVLVQALNLGVVHWQVPAVWAHLVAAAVEQRLPLGGHGLQRREHRVLTHTPSTTHAQVQSPTLLHLLLLWTLDRRPEETKEQTRMRKKQREKKKREMEKKWRK